MYTALPQILSWSVSRCRLGQQDSASQHECGSRYLSLAVRRGRGGGGGGGGGGWGGGGREGRGGGWRREGEEERRHIKFIGQKL